MLACCCVLVMQLKADGTVKGAAGTSVASSNALANPLLNVLTRGAFDNRPKAASSAYTQIPLALREYIAMLCHTVSLSLTPLRWLL